MNSKVGLIAYEGDLGTTGDGASILGGAGTQVPLGRVPPGTPPLNATNNVFDSSISAGGASVTTRAPADRNTLGFDADLFTLNGVLGNNQTSTAIRLTTNGDAYQPGAVTIATDLFAPKLVTTKTVDQAEADLGDTLTYTLTVQNTGQDGAQGVVLTDAVPDGTTYVPGSLTIGGAPVTDGGGDDAGDAAGGTVTARLGAGANAAAGGALAPGSAAITVTFQVTVDTAVPAPASVENVGRIAFTAQTTGDADVVTTAPAITAIRSPTVNLVTTKTVVSVPNPATSPPGFPANAYGPDDPIAFSITVTNEGALPAPNVVLTDVLPAPLRFLGAYIETPFSICANPEDPPAPPPVPLQCTIGTLAPGASATVVVGAVLPNDADLYPPTATLTNRATATSGGVETNPDDNSAEAEITTFPISDVYVRRRSRPPSRSRAAASPTRWSSGTAAPAWPTSSSATCCPTRRSPSTRSRSRAGPASARSASCPRRPACPLGLCNIPQLEVGGERVVTLTGTLRPGTRGQTVPNLAAVTPNGLESSATRFDDTATVAFAPQYVDLALEKTRLETGELQVGADTTFSLTVRNDGDATATDVVVTDTMPAGLTPLGTPAGCSVAGQVVTCDAGDLGPGASATFALGARAGIGAAGTTVVNAAAVSSSSPDVDAANDTATAGVPVAPATDLAASKTRLETGELLPGQETTFRITVRNLGPLTAAGALAGDLMPDGLTPVSAPAGCDIQGQIVLCDAGDLAAGAERSFDLVARADAAAAGTTVVNLGAALSSGTADPFPENNEVLLDVPIGVEPPAPPPPPPPPPAAPPAPVPTDVALRVIGPDGTVRAGEPSRWRIEVTNVSPVAAAGVTLDGAARGAALGTTARAAQAGCGPAPPDGCGLGTLAPGATRSVAVTLTPRRTGTLTLAGTVRVARVRDADRQQRRRGDGRGRRGHDRRVPARGRARDARGRRRAAAAAGRRPQPRRAGRARGDRLHPAPARARRRPRRRAPAARRAAVPADRHAPRRRPPHGPAPGAGDLHPGSPRDPRDRARRQHRHAPGAAADPRRLRAAAAGVHRLSDPARPTLRRRTVTTIVEAAGCA